MKTTIVGFPRIGENRELKVQTEEYLAGKLSFQELEAFAKDLRKKHLLLQRASIDLVTTGDFSYYDSLLDTSVLFNVIPERLRNLKLSDSELYFAIAKGYQQDGYDVKASPMRKWFNTNYHYITPEIDDNTQIKLNGSKPINDFLEAKQLNLTAKVVLTGPMTYLKLAKFAGNKGVNDFVDSLTNAYLDLFKKLSKVDCKYIQLDEPILVTDLESCDIELFKRIYDKLLSNNANLNIILQTYFGDVRDIYQLITSMPFYGIGLDFVESTTTLELLQKYGFPNNIKLIAGVVNGKNVWKNDYTKTLNILDKIREKTKNVILSSSCSLLHVPYTVTSETHIDEEIRSRLSFAKEKLLEIAELQQLLESNNRSQELILINNTKALSRINKLEKADVQDRVAKLTKADFVRTPDRETRSKIQQEYLNLPILPTTTIGSFPQTKEVRLNRSRYKTGKISKEEYISNVHTFIKDCIKLQEDLDLDVLVHGEFERNDMVEFFGENMSGFLFTKFAWVQSYGTRCVKPPIIYSDIKREQSITCDISKFAQSLTSKPVKGMLTGPITILNWSFPREDVDIKESAIQIALAIRDEVLELEASGIKIIQIDEAALREKLPIRKADRATKYLDWAIPAFRLTHSGVNAKTQIHTHMCYSEFGDIINEIDDMDADVISFEASKSSLEILNSIKACNFKTAVGPGVYDIHSPRVPTVEEITDVIKKILTVIHPSKLWINPDCGLKTRDIAETKASLTNLVQSAIISRPLCK
ncbi:MAG: 5-methyltetrahydropteroyltriglutamate--homocysteine S-methyltransferase [Christensenellaceae bacterium]|jgi:5-methyltetrahydropteroyltriglutamate--homocysteine methyltransferase|nr:5-methyltetrahydropteroyltriglutamate--homocysteine S-methyltransferase [Christensenellaceae bacterium]